jgi:hypothetical protein
LLQLVRVVCGPLGDLLGWHDSDSKHERFNSSLDRAGSNETISNQLT